MFENALTAGLTSMGMNVLLLGPVPTPAVGILTPSMRADLGIMISASHNPHEDNGIKFFGPDGFKLSDEAEQNIEELIGKDLRNVGLTDIGRAKRIEDGLFRYVERVKSSFPSGMRLDGMKVVIDCANGAGYRAAPEVLWELGADVIPVGVNPNGLNINKNCGSTNPQIAAEAVVSHGADVGICLDGDADRIILIDSEGNIADGDQIMGVIASRWFEDGLLTGSGIATTVMSNLGLERFLKQRGISMERTQVGDRYVVEHMRKSGFNLGGEQSGHIILSDFSTTGDGLIAGLQFLAEIIRSERGSKDLARIFEPVPQLLKNASYKAGSDPLSKPNVVKAIKAAELKLQNNGRLLIRKSGTEPLIRVMAESEDEEKMTKAVDSVVAEIIA
jgi:phosphoglucosamine mutase